MPENAENEEASTSPAEAGSKAQKRRWGGRWVAVNDHPVARRGQGTVWKVCDAAEAPKAGPPALYALKEMRYAKTPGSSAYRRFVQEIETTNSLAQTHTGIVTVVDSHLSGDPTTASEAQPYYVMPWADVTLDRARFLAGPDGLERVLRISIAIADALSAGHAATPRVIHRDVKPANVLLFGDTHDPRLADYGICYLDDEERGRLTGTEAQTIGSDGFVAPELAGGGKVDAVGPLVDVYSLGKTMYAVAAGGDPFPRESHRNPKWHLTQQTGDPRFDHLHGLLDHMVAEDPSMRYQTMDLCRAQLARALANLRQGVPYVPGMYGVGESPLERMLTLASSLEAAPSIRRSDGLHRLLDRSVTTADKKAAEFAAKNTSLSAAVGQPFHGALPVAADCADELLAAGLPLVQHDEVEAFEEWLRRATAFTEKDNYRYATDRIVLAGAGVLAAYAVAAQAWMLRRHRILRVVVDRHVEVSCAWIHLELLGRSAGAVLPWVNKTLPTLSTFRRADPSLAASTTLVTPMLPALYSLKDLLSSSDQVLKSLSRGAIDEVDLPAYPMCYFDGVTWAKTLAGACLDSRTREEGIAQEIMERTPEAFREGCRTVTPALAGLTHRLNREIHRMVEWRFSVDGDGLWRRWCGGVPLKEA